MPRSAQAVRATLQVLAGGSPIPQQPPQLLRRAEEESAEGGSVAVRIAVQGSGQKVLCKGDVSDQEEEEEVLRNHEGLLFCSVVTVMKIKFFFYCV